MEGHESRPVVKNPGETITSLVDRYLQDLRQKKPFGVDDTVVTLEGTHAHKDLKVLEIKEDGTVRVAPAEDTSINLEINSEKLYHIDDRHNAFKEAMLDQHRMTAHKSS